MMNQKNNNNKKTHTCFSSQSFSYPETDYDKFLEYSAAQNGALEEENIMTLMNTIQPPVYNTILSD